MYIKKVSLQESHVLIVGLGGLGSPVSLYLAAAGVGNLYLADFDKVDLSNLQRQILHETSDLQKLKTFSAQARLQRLNPDVKIILLNQMIAAAQLVEWIPKVDVVVDCCDNFATRFALNLACVQLRKPLVSGAAIRWTGQVTVFDLRQAESPCYRCLYEENEDAADTCTQSGIIAPLVGIIGSLQALEALKLLQGLPSALCGKLLIIQADTLQKRVVNLRKDKACPVCCACH